MKDRRSGRLVLTRKVGERILIGDGIYVEVVAIQGKRARIGVVADRNIRIYREELVDDNNSSSNETK